MGTREGYDVVVIGARCAGAPLAARLAATGARVLVLDHRPPPANTVSTHVVFPNTLERLAELGALERLAHRHRLNYLLHRISILGHEIAGGFTPIGGVDRCLCIRRPALDQALLDAAVDAGAETRFGEKVVGLIGGGDAEDQVRGVVLEDGARIEADWVIGADGRASTVARALKLEGRRPMAGELGILFTYWRGLPETEFMHIDAHEDLILNWAPCEDDVKIVIANGGAEFTKGDAAERERRLLDAMTRFPETLPPEAAERAERISPIIVAPETMMRGFFRQAAGAGWALVGDAGHYKHPATAQGICDAIEQAIYVAEALEGADPGLDGYETWRDRRADEHYEWSFQLGSFPRPEVAHPVWAGLERDDQAAQAMRDTMTRRTRPRSEVFTRERLAGWLAAAETPA